MELTRFLMLAAGVRALTVPLPLPVLTPLTPLVGTLTPLGDVATKPPATPSQTGTTTVTGGPQLSEIAGKAETRSRLVEPSSSDTKLYLGTSGSHWVVVSGSNPLATATANNATGTDSPMATPAPDFTGVPEVMARVFEVGGVTVSDNSESKLVVGSQTLKPGSSIVVGTGVSTTPIALHTDKGTTRIVVGTTTTVVPTPTPAYTKKPAQLAGDGTSTSSATSSRPTVATIPAGTIAYNSKTQIIVNGHTLNPSSTLTLGTGTKATAYHLAVEPTITYLAVASEGSSGASTTMIDLWGSEGVPTGLDRNSGNDGSSGKSTATSKPTATATKTKETVSPTTTSSATTMQTTTMATAASSVNANGDASAQTLGGVSTIGGVSWVGEETTPASAAAATYTGAAAPGATIDYSRTGALGFFGVALAMFV